MTSQRCAPSVLRTKPTDCGYHVYASFRFSFCARSSANLFSNPSPLSLENGRLRGSAQTRTRFGSTSSSPESGPAPCACDERTETTRHATPISAATGKKQPKIGTRVIRFCTLISALLAQAGVLCLGKGLRLRLTLLRPHPPESIVGAGAQIDVGVIDIAHHIRIGAECRHDV